MNKDDFSGPYAACRVEHAVDYLQPGKKPFYLRKIYSEHRVKFIKVSGTFISNGAIDGTTKATEIINRIEKKTIRQEKTPTETDTPGIRNQLDLTRYLQENGYDIYIGTDNSDEQNNLECIILNPEKFSDRTETKIHSSQKNGKYKIENHTEYLEQNQIAKKINQDFEVKTALTKLLNDLPDTPFEKETSENNNTSNQAMDRPKPLPRPLITKINPFDTMEI